MSPRQAQTAASGVPRHAVFSALVLRMPFSGVENAVTGQAQALVSIRDPDWRFSVLWPNSLDDSGNPPFVSRSTVLRQGPRMSSRALRMLWEQVVLPLRLRSLRADLLHAPAYLAPVLAPCPVVLSVYDLHVLDHPGRCRKLNRWNYRVFLPASIRRAARVIVPSDSIRDALLRRFPGMDDRVRMIPLGIDSRFDPDPPFPIPPADAGRVPARYLLCVGNLEPRKNLRLAVEALGLLRNSGYSDLGLVVAGKETQPDPAFDQAVSQHGLDTAVVRLGYVPERWLPRLYADAVALVFPSFEEGFGLPPLEAMACGCPVLCSDSPTLRQTTGGAALYFHPGDSRELAVTADYVLANPKRRAELIARALVHAGQFQWRCLIRRIVEVYGEACPGHGGSSTPGGGILA